VSSSFQQLLSGNLRTFPFTDVKPLITILSRSEGEIRAFVRSWQR
jgi:hypothetical protein